jgi:hypothetical protein
MQSWSADRQQEPRDRSIGSQTALLQVHTCSLRSVVTLFSDREERHGFVQLSSQINIQYSRVPDT